MAGSKDLCAIVGIGETEYSRFNEKKRGRALGIEAIQNALDDAGMTGKDIDGIIVEGIFGNKWLPMDDASSNFGIKRTYSAEVGTAGAGTTGSVLAATGAIKAGLASTVLVYYVAQWGSLARSVYDVHEEEWPVKADFEFPYGFYAQPSYFGAMANRYRHVAGLSYDQLEKLLGTIAVTTRKNGILNGKAQQMKPLSFDDYLANETISYPLRKADCCLNTDGAAAVIVTSMDRAKNCPSKPVKVLSGGYACLPISGAAVLTQEPGYPWMPSYEEAMEQALRRADVSVKDINFAEIYDCFTISVALELEELGLCGKCEAADFVKDGHIDLNGSFPINTNGGQLSHSYLCGMTQITEAVKQIRGEAGATQVKKNDIGLVGGKGGHEYGTLILGKA